MMHAVLQLRFRRKAWKQMHPKNPCLPKAQIEKTAVGIMGVGGGYHIYIYVCVCYYNTYVVMLSSIAIRKHNLA